MVFIPYFDRVVVLLLLGGLLSGLAVADETKSRLLILDANLLQITRKQIAEKTPITLEALASLKTEADRALKAGPFTIIHKKINPPSGDKRDYMSVGPYWWPDPKTKDGLPYIRRDGQVNPEKAQDDSRPLSLMCKSVDVLARAWYFRRDEKYAKHAVKQLRVWFLVEKTRMNPNLNFGQAIPGRTIGRGVGTIETRQFISLLDSITLLRESDDLTDADYLAIRDWFSKFAKWLRESPNGQSAFRAKNNIGTWYDAQTIAVSLFAGHDDAAKKMLSTAGERRFAYQITPDGRLPHELARTRSFEYTAMNLIALQNLAALSKHVGIDLWSYQTDDGRSLRAALDWFAPYASGEKRWPYKQIKNVQRDTAALVYLRAAHQFDSDRYRSVIRRIEQLNESDATNQLLWPVVPK